LRGIPSNDPVLMVKGPGKMYHCWSTDPDQRLGGDSLDLPISIAKSCD